MRWKAESEREDAMVLALKMQGWKKKKNAALEATKSKAKGSPLEDQEGGQP